MTVFSVPIFFIVFRETLEAAIIVSVLLGLVEQIVRGKDDKGIFITDWRHPNHPEHAAYLANEKQKADDKAAATAAAVSTAPGDVPELRKTDGSSTDEASEDAEGLREIEARKLIRRLRIQIFLGSVAGLFIALAIGAAFIAVWFTQASDLWTKSEELWEGIFSLVAALIILVMGITMLKLDRARAKWSVKLARAFDKSRAKHDRGGRAGRWVLFLLPFITVLREGLEAVVFVGGVSLGQSARAIPLAAVVGIVCGLVCGFVIYAFASRATLTAFLIIMTNFILLIGAGLFSKAVGNFQTYEFNHLLGADVDDAGGDGPGSFDVRGSVWHLDCCNPENKLDGQGWSIFNALFGWTNSATLGTVLSYVFYWLLAIAILVYLKFTEGRTTLLGRESAAGRRRRVRKEDQSHGARGEKEEADVDVNTLGHGADVHDASRHVAEFSR